MNSPDTGSRAHAIRALVARKAQALGAHDHVALATDHAVSRYRAGHTAHRAIRAGVMLAAELADNLDPR